MSAPESIQSRQGPLAFGPAARGSTSFKEIRTQWSDGDRMRFGLDWAHREGSLDVGITYLASTAREVIDTYRLRDVVRGELRFDIDLADERAADITTYTLDGAPGRLRFEGWCPTVLEGFSRPDVGDRLETESRDLGRLAESIHWLGSMRALPERAVPLFGSSNSIQANGAGTIEVLAREKKQASNSAVLDQVSAWFQTATAHALRVEEQAAGGASLFHVELQPLRAPRGIHLADTGEGMTQVLPVITLGALAMNGRLGETPILAIEQPELHLHPRAHAHVARHLIAVAAHATVVVETHSENFLLAVQLAIASGEIKAADVIVHWVKATDEGPSFVETITFDDKARPSAWPPDVFAEDRELARRIIEIRHNLGSS